MCIGCLCVRFISSVCGEGIGCGERMLRLNRCVCVAGLHVCVFV